MNGWNMISIINWIMALKSLTCTSELCHSKTLWWLQILSPRSAPSIMFNYELHIQWSQFYAGISWCKNSWRFMQTLFMDEQRATSSWHVSRAYPVQTDQLQLFMLLVFQGIPCQECITNNFNLFFESLVPKNLFMKT